MRNTRKYPCVVCGATKTCGCFALPPAAPTPLSAAERKVEVSKKKAAIPEAKKARRKPAKRKPAKPLTAKSVRSFVKRELRKRMKEMKQLKALARAGAKL